MFVWGRLFPGQSKTCWLVIRAAAAAIARRKLRFGMYSAHHLLRYLPSEVRLIEWLIFGLGNVLSLPREIVQLLTDAPGARRVCTDLAGL